MKVNLYHICFNCKDVHFMLQRNIHILLFYIIQSHNLLNHRFDSVCKIFWKNSCLSQESFQVVWGPQNSHEDRGVDGLEKQSSDQQLEDPAMIKFQGYHLLHYIKIYTPSCFVFPTFTKSRIVWLCFICFAGSIFLSFSSKGCLRCGLSLSSLSGPSGFSLLLLIWEGEP